jgi:hypothetical protein
MEIRLAIYPTPGRHQAFNVQPLLQYHPGHQYRNRYVSAALDALDALGFAVAALEARQGPGVFLDVLGHEHDVSLGVLDEIGIAAAHQLGDLGLEALATDPAVQRDQHPTGDLPSGLVHPRPRNARSDVERRQALGVLCQHLGGEALKEGFLDHGHLSRDLATNLLLDLHRFAGDGPLDSLLDLRPELATPAAQLRLGGSAIDADGDFHAG